MARRKLHRLDFRCLGRGRSRSATEAKTHENSGEAGALPPSGGGCRLVLPEHTSTRTSRQAGNGGNRGSRKSETRDRGTDERGAAVFVVVLAITLLTAIGVFALRNASLVEQAAGYDRQASQTLYLTEYAARSVAAEVGSGAGRTYIDKVATGTDTCYANKQLDANALDPNISYLPCYKLFYADIGQRVDKQFSNQKLLDQQSNAAPGSLGPQLDNSGVMKPMEGVFVVEMTDPAESTPTAGSALGGNNPANTFRDVQLTFTAFAQIRQFDPGGAWCSNESLSTSASVTSLRSHVTLRNVPR